MIHSKIRTVLGGFITLMFALISYNNVAIAAPYDSCNGQPIMWRSNLTIYRNSCWIPGSGDQNTAYWNGVDQWNDLSDVVDSFRVWSDCTNPVIINNGDSEVAIVPRADIDGANGLTTIIKESCGSGAADILEADVEIASDLNFTNRDGNFLGTSGRSTFAHEFGHLFGFKHDGTSVHSIERPSPPHLLTGGTQSSTIWIRDAMGMEDLYDFSVSRPNLLPSSLGVVNNVVTTLDSASTVTVCRGASTTVKFYMANMGNTAAGAYYARIRLNTTAPQSGGYTANTTVVATYYKSSHVAFGSYTQTFTITIPTSLSNGTYYIYFDMDYTGAVTELREGDNRTVSAKKIRVNC